MNIESLIPEIDKIFSPYAKNNTPGCALAIVLDGNIIYENGYGLAQMEYHIPITPNSIFHVASVSKQFTCFAILLLDKEGKLSLDDDFRKFLPELTDFGKKLRLGIFAITLAA